uniref:Uncharacterized protein n=1 Tax=uncultured marine virus TaxID=186617 RepID=A0A0F7L9X2_9VIRU|nr:hypothetical protein [uncultured marine virus]
MFLDADLTAPFPCILLFYNSLLNSIIKIQQKHQYQNEDNSFHTCNKELMFLFVMTGCRTPQTLFL